MAAEELVQERLRASDLPGAATAAIRELGPGVARFLRSMLRDEADAADAFSDWAESLWAGIGSFQGRSSFTAWAFRLAFNAARTRASACYPLTVNWRAGSIPLPSSISTRRRTRPR